MGVLPPLTRFKWFRTSAREGGRSGDCGGDCAKVMTPAWREANRERWPPSSETSECNSTGLSNRLTRWANLTRVYRASAPNAAPHRACDYGETRSPCTSSSSAAASLRSALVQSEAPPSHQSRPVRRLPLLLPPTYRFPAPPEPRARVNLPEQTLCFQAIGRGLRSFQGRKQGVGRRVLEQAFLC